MEKKKEKRNTNGHGCLKYAFPLSIKYSHAQISAEMNEGLQPGVLR